MSSAYIVKLASQLDIMKNSFAKKMATCSIQYGVCLEQEHKKEISRLS